jgi:hypothetical protein
MIESVGSIVWLVYIFVLHWRVPPLYVDWKMNRNALCVEGAGGTG